MTRELQEIVSRIEQLEPGASAVLATVVDVRGSSYRLPGAKMLILENGQTFGMVSGGCLEADVLERAKKVIRTGKTDIFTYDTTGDENSVFSLNMGCRGVIRILLEKVGEKNPIVETIRRVSESRTPAVVATLIGSNNGNLGTRAVYDAATGFNADGLPANLQNISEFRSACIEALNNDPDSKTFETSEAEPFEFSFEVIHPPITLQIFGAGSDAIPLAGAAELLGWQVSVLDHRPAYLEESRFPVANDRILIRSDGPNPEIVTDDLTAVVIMSHNYERDRENLARALYSGAFYIGALGPKRRTEQILQELNAQGKNFSNEQLKKLYAPAGLDIGADTPQSIALAIVAEIQAALRDRDGGFLRDRQGPIYDRNNR